MNKKTSVRLFLACYIVVGAMLLLSSLANYVQDSIYIATGTIKQTEYKLADFSSQDIKFTGEDSFVTSSTDPQLIIEGYNARATSLEIDLEYDTFPGEVTLYYTRGSEEYTVEQKVYGVLHSNGKYTFALPRGHLYSLRIDPTSISDVNIKVNRIVLNPRRSFISYFAYSGEVLFNYIVLTALAASALAWGISAALASPAIASVLNGIITNFISKKGRAK